MLKGFTKWISDGIIWPNRKVVNVEYIYSNNILHTQISPEEFELQVYCKLRLSSVLTQKEKERLFELISEYGDARYNEGYEAAEIDSED